MALYLCTALGNCTAPGQDNVIELGERSGAFFSPLYPARIPGNMMCTWIIAAPEGNYVKLKVVSHCWRASLEVRDGNASWSPLTDQLCDLHPGTRNILSSGRYLWVRFNSTRDIRLKGFYATYHVIKNRKFFVFLSTLYSLALPLPLPIPNPATHWIPVMTMISELNLQQLLVFL